MLGWRNVADLSVRADEHGCKSDPSQVAKERQKGMAGAHPVALEPYELSGKGFRAECFPV